MPSLTHHLAALVADPRRRLSIHPQWHGYCVRNDGWGARRWTHDGDYHVVYICQFGEMRYAWNGAVHTATPGQALVVGADTRPDVQWSQQVEVWEIYVKISPRPPLTGLWKRIERMPAPVEAPGLVDRLHTESLVWGGFERLPLLRPRLHLLFSLLAEEARLEHSGAVRQLTPHQRIRLVRWTREHLADPPTPRQLAGLMGLTLDYFARLFQATFHLAPREWLLRERVQAARRLLDEGGVSIAEAMRQTGFRNAVHFGRTMAQFTGRTPGGRPALQRRTFRPRRR